MNLNSSPALSAFAQRLLPRVERLTEGGFNELALELFELQRAHNPALARVCAPFNPSSVSDWSELPSVPAAAFKELEMTSIPAGSRLREFRSSGTTVRKPSRHYHHAESLRLYEASLVAWHAPHFGWDSACPRLVFLTPPPEQAPHSSLAHMLDTLGRRAPGPGYEFSGRAHADGSWSLDGGRAAEWLGRSVHSGEPLALLGTAFNFVQLLDALEERDLRFQLPSGSRVMETGGYKGRTRALPQGELHRWMWDRLGIPDSHVICEYGMSELSSQAYDHAIAGAPRPELSARRVFRFPPWARALLVSPETGRPVAEGETGLIRVVDLANVWSCLAVQTEDLGIRRADGFELAGRAPRAEPRGCSLQTA